MHWSKVYSYITCIGCNRHRKETRSKLRLYFAPLVVVPEVHCLCFQLDFQPAIQIKRTLQSSDQSFNAKLQLVNRYKNYKNICRYYFAMRVPCKWVLFTRNSVTVYSIMHTVIVLVLCWYKYHYIHSYFYNISAQFKTMR